MPAFLSQPMIPSRQRSKSSEKSNEDIDGVPLENDNDVVVVRPQISPTALAPSIVNPLQRKTLIQQKMLNNQKSEDLGHVVDLNNQAERKRKKLAEETAKKIAEEAKRMRTPKNTIATPVISTASGTLLQDDRTIFFNQMKFSVSLIFPNFFLRR